MRVSTRMVSDVSEGSSAPNRSVYVVSEYTSTGKAKYVINYCLERPQGSPMPPGYEK